MAKGDADEARMMTALVTGGVSAGLMQLKDTLVQPVTFEKIDPNGAIEMRLASGMTVTISIHVEALAGPKGR